MSYDLTVFGSPLPDDVDVAVANAVAGLELGPRADGEFTVLHSEPKTYAFTVFGPYDVEPEDVPAEVVDAARAVGVRWLVVVEGSHPDAIEPARSFAGQLARAAAGAAVDEQTGELLDVGGTVRQPARQIVSTLDLEWYSPAAADAVQTWLTVTRSSLPEAVPNRFGNFEPLQYRLDRDGEQQLAAVALEGLTFTTALPCLGGRMSPATLDGLQRDTLRLLADSIDDPRRRDAVRGFFVEYARRRRSVLATGQICRNIEYGSSFGANYRADSDRHGKLTGRGGILGLDPHPVWWTWFGAEYLPLVRDHLPDERVTAYDDGVLYTATDEPADRRQLAELPDPIPASLRTTIRASRYIGPGVVVSAPKYNPAEVRPAPSSAG